MAAPITSAEPPVAEPQATTAPPISANMRPLSAADQRLLDDEAQRVGRPSARPSRARAPPPSRSACRHCRPSRPRSASARPAPRSSAIASSNWPITSEASTAVTRLIDSHARASARGAPAIGVHVVGADAAHPQQVFLGLLVDHVDHVVDHDHAEQAAALVDHRAGHQVLVAEQVRHLVLVGGRRHRGNVGIDDVERSAPAAWCAACGRAAPMPRSRPAASRRRTGRRRRPAGRCASRQWSMTSPTVQLSGTLTSDALHEAAGAVLGIGQRALDRRRAPPPASRPAPRAARPRQILENRGRVVGFRARVRGGGDLLAVELVETSSRTSSSSSVSASGSRSRLEDADQLRRAGARRPARGTSAWPGR